MTAVNLKKILNDANKNNYAVAGLVVLGWDDALAFTQAADETGTVSYTHLTLPTTSPV